MARRKYARFESRGRFHINHAGFGFTGAPPGNMFETGNACPRASPPLARCSTSTPPPRLLIPRHRPLLCRRQKPARAARRFQGSRPRSSLAGLPPWPLLWRSRLRSTGNAKTLWFTGPRALGRSAAPCYRIASTGGVEIFVSADSEYGFDALSLQLALAIFQVGDGVALAGEQADYFRLWST